jgi:hypothetical protein
VLADVREVDGLFERLGGSIVVLVRPLDSSVERLGDAIIERLGAITAAGVEDAWCRAAPG